MTERKDLSEKLEIIGSIFEIDGMEALVSKYEAGMGIVKFNAITIRIEALLLKENRAVADELIAKNKGITEEEVDKMDDGEYSLALRNAILTDVVGFFPSSQHTDGQR